MSCDVALSAALLFAAFSPARTTTPALTVIPAVASAAPRLNPIAREPLFAKIVAEAERLKGQVDSWRAGPTLPAQPGLDAFKSQVAALSALDMQGHVELARRGTDGDLKCILKGISQDLPRKLDEVAAADDVSKRKIALDELFYLLRDNVEVITTPPTVHS
jgi:hypothetical protein